MVGRGRRGFRGGNGRGGNWRGGDVGRWTSRWDRYRGVGRKNAEVEGNGNTERDDDDIYAPPVDARQVAFCLARKKRLICCRLMIMNLRIFFEKKEKRKNKTIKLIFGCFFFF